MKHSNEHATTLQIFPKGCGHLLPVSGGQGGGDPEEVQGPHQNGADPHQRHAVRHVRRRPQGGGHGHRTGTVAGQCGNLSDSC